MHKMCINFNPCLFSTRFDQKRKKIEEELAKEEKPKVVSNKTVVKKMKVDESEGGTKVVFVKEYVSILKGGNSKKQSATAVVKKVQFNITTVDDEFKDRYALAYSLMEQLGQSKRHDSSSSSKNGIDWLLLDKYYHTDSKFSSGKATNIEWYMNYNK